VDLSPAKNLEYFCDGIAEEVINILTRVPSVSVVARGPAFQFKGKDQDPRRIAADLRVRTVLGGSVRASGDRLRILAKLENEEGEVLWAQRFDRRLDETFALQDEIAAAAVSALGVHTSGRTLRGEAFRYYLEGRHFWNKRTEADLYTSLERFGI